MPEAKKDHPMEIASILLDHQRRYPLWQIKDVYKLLHQAAMGSEHAVQDESSVNAWMERELKEMKEGPDEPLIDILSPDGAIVRVHLRPYITKGNDPEKLLRAFIQTAREYCSSWSRLAQFLQVAVEMTSMGALHFNQRDMTHFFDTMQYLNYPAQHHSAEYETAYRPAYRVIDRPLLVIQED
jgi:hypothetical protein